MSNSKKSEYTKLGCYNRSNNTGSFVTPNYSSPVYDTLNHSVGGNQQYLSMTNAYGKGADSCNISYTTRPCSSCLKTRENYSSIVKQGATCQQMCDFLNGKYAPDHCKDPICTPGKYNYCTQCDKGDDSSNR